VRVVLANGVFDPLHYGHVLHLRAARKFGDYLVVAVAADNTVNKGPRRPVFAASERADMLKELRCVTRVIIVSSAEEAIRLIKPNFYAKGLEYKGKGKLPEARLVRALGGRVVFTDTRVYSSTALLSHLCKSQASTGERTTS